MAQITPDDTLGNERSQVNRNVQVRGGNADRIEGGATRGANLFHSFREFNVNEGQRVYFGNPSGIANILGRVTGRDVSDIMGTLGVDGDANLFLLNPNGIIFGPDARLDISGSFVSSTANSFTFSDGTEFSATNPGNSSLLSVNVPLGVQYGPNAPGAIANAGTLSVGQNFTLSGGSVTSTGQLAVPSGQLLIEGVAGDVRVRNASAQTATFSASNNLILQDSQLQTAGDLNLLAGNTVQVRDSVANPFVAYSGGNLTVQGNQGIDIFALNHPSSGLVSGGDMVLRSANTVGGDAHYWTGGNFRIEQLNGELGSLFSPYDPVIRSIGDVSFESYEGASLHIFAGGSVTIGGNVRITGVDAMNGISDSFSLVDPSDPTVTVPVDIDGASFPTLDIRAGITDSSLLTPSLTPETNFPGTGTLSPNNTPSLNEDPIGSTIRIGSITNRSPGGRGQVLLTNQYRSDGSVPGLIEITSGIIDPQATNLGSQSISAYGSDVMIVSSGNVRIANGAITGSGGSDGGSIQIYSGDSITTDSLQSLANNGNGGSVTLSSLGTIMAGNIVSVTTANGEAGGEITITANGGDIRTGAIRSFVGNYDNDTDVSTGGTGNAGDIRLDAPNGLIDVNGRIASFTGSGNAGNISLNARGNVEIFSARSFVGSYDPSKNTDENPSGGVETGIGSAGNITISSSIGDITLDPNGPRDLLAFSRDSTEFSTIRLDAEQGSVTLDRATFNTTNEGSGNAGDIYIGAEDEIRIVNNSTISTDGNFGRVFLGPNSDEPDITSPQRITITDSRITATENIDTEDIVAGDIYIGADDEIQLNNSEISTDGNLGRIFLGPNSEEPNITSPQRIAITNSRITTRLEEEATGTSGDIKITADSFRLTDGAQLSSSTFGNGDAGAIEINAEYEVLITGADTDIFNQITRNATGDGGSITITTNSFELSEGAELSASTFGTGNAGAIDINAEDEVVLSGATIFNNVEEGGVGNAGDIDIDTPSLTLSDGAEIQSLVRAGNINTQEERESRVNGGTITVKARDIVLKDKSQFFTRIEENSVGTGGNIKINANSLRIKNNLTDTDNKIFTVLDAQAFNDSSSAGSITIDADQFNLQNSGVTVSNTQGKAGSLSITANSIELDKSELSAIAGEGDLGNIEIELLGTLLQLYDNSLISAGAEGVGSGGDLTINAENGFVLANPYGNSDILANAFEGNGGNITITTNAIFGLEERNPLTDLSDINADSEFNTPGNIVIDTLNIDPTRGLSELPIEIVNAADLVAEGCIGSNRSGVESQGEFTRTGRGGLSPDPTGTLTDESLIERSTPADTDNRSGTVPSETSPQPLVEAQGLARDASGKVSLVTYSTNPTVPSPLFSPNTCDAP
ncbi:MAG: filamentous hemagglutinin N-terminal domain-containing protein [Xenococcaceae cyanobacterium MO_188.B29]|nr:filamentous hemagglutinin N-terminal domain-containing protein [Xenococcaceae cyanobacterium MO_188.B29]